MGEIKAIETHYRGHRFRSRLEARWAVVFDALGFKWEYEAQGYECKLRLTAGLWTEESAEVINYLPDFWLPDAEMHAEVKGSLTELELRRLLECAAYLAEPDGFGSTGETATGEVGSGRPVFILGPDLMLPWILTMRKGSLVASLAGGANVAYSRSMPWVVATDGSDRHPFRYGDPSYGWGEVAGRLLRSDLGPTSKSPWYNALRAGRSARFEHGETPH